MSVAAVTQIDRYVLTLFLRTVGICFVSVAGVFVVFHAFNNIPELTELAEQRGSSVTIVMVGYYAPLMFRLFDWTAAIIALMALLFVVGWLRRTGEITASLAAGVSHGRILRPIILAAFVLVICQSANREWVLPSLRDALRLSSDLTGDAAQPMLPSYDSVNGILLEADSIRPKSKQLIRPHFRVDGDYPGFGEALKANSAAWMPANHEHPEGYLLEDVTTPELIDTIASAGTKDRVVLMTARDNAWVPPGSCFVATTVNSEILQIKQTSTRLSSAASLFTRLRNPAVHNSPETEIVLHERVIRPPLDFSLFLLGLPMVVNRKDRNLFTMAGSAIGTVMLYFVLKMAAGALGGSGYLLSPAMAAWLPLIVLGPFAYMHLREVETV